MIEKPSRILLVEPPFYRLYKNTYSLAVYPLSLAYLAGTIRRESDWDVMAYNADFHPRNDPMRVSYLAGPGFSLYQKTLGDPAAGIWDEVRSVITGYRPCMVGISSKSQNFKAACRVAEIAKQIDNSIVVVVGGPHPTMVGPDVLACPHIDIAARGEGEGTIVELLDALRHGNDLAVVNGLVYRKGADIIETPSRELIADIDTLCFPHEAIDGTLKDHRQYPPDAFMNIFSSRGCPHNCFFCGSRNIWGRKVRFRSPENVVREIQGLKEMGLTHVNFEDDMFGVTAGRIRDLCEAITSACAPLAWSCEMHVRSIDDGVVAAMKSAGCRSIQVGIESGDNDMLQRIRKNFTIEQAFKACEIVKRHGINLQTFFMVGFPEETETTLAETVRAMRRIRSDAIICSIFTPYPGTESFEFCKDRGLIDESYDVSLFNHQSPENCFCLNIAPDRFKALVARVGRLVDRINRRASLKNALSLSTIAKIRLLGVRESLRKAANILRN